MMMPFSPRVHLLSVLLAAASFIKSSVSAQKDHPDRVAWLPGFPHELPSPWYSGFLDYQLNDVTIHTHYLLIEAETNTNNIDSNNNEVPLIYWSNGGPGASSLFGVLTELGPLLLSELSLKTHEHRRTGIPTPLHNPHSWTKLGHLLVFDAPAPVGYSYCNNDPRSVTDCLAWTDELASQNAYLALQEFYNKFPQYQSKPLYLTGESYAGIYIPTLARRILQDTTTSINLQGFAVGDACLGTQTEVCGNLVGEDSWKIEYFELLFFAGHGQIPLSTFVKTMQACHGDQEEEEGEDDDGTTMSLRTGTTTTSMNHKLSKISPKCQAMIRTAMEQIGGFFEYSLYDDCTYNNGLLLKHNPNLDLLDLNSALNDYPCGQGPVSDHYLALTAVQEALHIPEGGFFFSVDNAENFNYTPTEPDLTGFYRDVAMNKYERNVRVLVYNGDTDPAITSFAAQDWTSNLGLREVESWRPWTIDGCRRMGGYVTRYEGSLDMLTIRGAGHMVPTYKPEASFAFLKAWIQNEDYSTYDKECKVPSSMQENAANVGVAEE